MMIISNYMHSKNVSKDLQYQIRQYLHYYWREDSSHNVETEQKIIQQLSDNLREELLMEANKNVLIDSPIFRDNFSDGFISKMVPLIKEMRFTPEEKIINQGEVSDQSIYFVQKGRAEMCSYYSHPTFKKQTMINKITEINKGQCFGQIGFFIGKERSFSIRSVEFTTILAIKRNDFLILLQEFPEDYERFCMIRDKVIISSDYQTIDIKCLSCKKPTHMIGECKTLHFIPNKYKLIYDISVGQPQKQKQFKRKLQKKNKVPQEVIIECAQLIQENLEEEIEEYYSNNIPESEDDENLTEESENQYEDFSERSIQQDEKPISDSMDVITKKLLAPTQNEARSQHQQCTSIQLLQIDEEQQNTNTETTISHTEKDQSDIQEKHQYKNDQDELNKEKYKLEQEIKDPNMIKQSIKPSIPSTQKNEYSNPKLSHFRIGSQKAINQNENTTMQSRNKKRTFTTHYNNQYRNENVQSNFSNAYIENIPSCFHNEEQQGLYVPRTMMTGQINPVQASLFNQLNNHSNFNQQSSLDQYITKYFNDEQNNQLIKKSQALINLMQSANISQGSINELKASQQNVSRFFSNPIQNQKTISTNYARIQTQNKNPIQNLINQIANNGNGNKIERKNVKFTKSIVGLNNKNGIDEQAKSRILQVQSRFEAQNSNKFGDEDQSTNDQALMEFVTLQQYLHNASRQLQLADCDPLTGELIFDRLKEYKIYFPFENVSNVIYNINKLDKLQKEFDLEERLNFVNQNLVARRVPRVTKLNEKKKRISFGNDQDSNKQSIRHMYSSYKSNKSLKQSLSKIDSQSSQSSKVSIENLEISSKQKSEQPSLQQKSSHSLKQTSMKQNSLKQDTQKQSPINQNSINQQKQKIEQKSQPPSPTDIANENTTIKIFNENKENHLECSRDKVSNNRSSTQFNNDDSEIYKLNQNNIIQKIDDSHQHILSNSASYYQGDLRKQIDMDEIEQQMNEELNQSD